MLEESVIRAAAQKVVTLSKSSARIDTGALKRSISYSYVKGVVIFRELYYGKFGNNSMLEKNARKYIPYGTAWKIIYTTFGGKTVEVTSTVAGRRSQTSLIGNLLSTSTNKIKALIARNKAKGNGETED
jgi:hypothetical protein